MSAPSFSSFPPSFSSFPDDSADTRGASSNAAAESSTSGKARKDRRTENYGEKLEEDRRKERHSGRDKSHRTSLRKERRDRNDSERTKKHGDLLGKDEASSSEPANMFFYSDYKGDPLNLQYGGLHTAHIPKHRLVAGGRNILGLPKALVVLRRFGKGVEVGPSYYRKSSSLTDSSSRAALLQPPSRRIVPLTDDNRFQEEDGFIRLPSRRRRTAANIESYRSITVGKSDDRSDSSSISESEDDASSEDNNDQPVLSAHQETLKHLDQELSQNPDAVDTWIALLQQTLSTIPITSKNATKARCEITVSILSRALSASPRNARSKELRIPYLKAGEEIWHESKLRSEWAEALKDGGIELQMEWLEWKIRQGQNGIGGVIEAATYSLSSLVGDDDHVEIARVRTFWRVATALRGAGYCEQAMAMFQAQAELSFKPPPNVAKIAFETQLDELEEFWESEVPRLGEKAALGWGSWYLSKASQPLTPSLQRVQAPLVSDLDLYRQWANQELELDRKTYLPLRSDAEAADPYSTVLFLDIRPLMLNIKSRAAKSAFRLAWLSFLGLHTPGLSLTASLKLDWDDRWNLGHLTTPSMLNSIFPSSAIQRNLLTDTVAGVVIGREREYNTPFGPVRCWGSNVSGPLNLSSSDPSKPLRRGIWSAEEVQGVDHEVARNVFAALRFNHDDSDWNVLALAFEAALNPKNAAKLSKSLLSVHQDSLQLWGAHAQLERMRGRLNDARKVYQTILIGDASKQTQNQTSLMWWNWAEMEWLSGDDQASLNVILKSVGLQGSQSGVTVLRAKRLLDDNAKSTEAQLGWKEQDGWIKLRALLELLTGNEPLQMLKVFEEHLPPSNEGLSRESLVTAYLMMLYCYGTILKRPMPPSLLRDRVHPAFESYPNNSIILGILLEAERGQGVWGRVRTLLGGNDGKPKDVARRIEEVWVAGWEKGRWVSELERTRNGLASAVEHERTRASPVIWRIYIEFEIRARELHRAKKILFRAIGECPLVKELYLLAFGPLRSVFQVHELNGLADTMAERGIRLRQNLDEILGQMDVTEGVREGSEDSEDEIEHNARELRRLMPY